MTSLQIKKKKNKSAQFCDITRFLFFFCFVSNDGPSARSGASQETVGPAGSARQMKGPLPVESGLKASFGGRGPDGTRSAGGLRGDENAAD